MVRKKWTEGASRTPQTILILPTSLIISLNQANQIKRRPSALIADLLSLQIDHTPFHSM